MAELLKMRLVRGKFYLPNGNDNVKIKVGSVVELTPAQVEAFGDRFEPVGLAQERLEAAAAAEAAAEAEVAQAKEKAAAAAAEKSATPAPVAAPAKASAPAK